MNPKNKFLKTGIGNLAFDISDFANNVGVLSHIHVHLGLINGRDMTLCASEVDGEWEGVKGMELSDLVCRVDDHFGLLDEGQAKDGVDGNVGADCNHECSGSPFLREVW